MTKQSKMEKVCISLFKPLCQPAVDISPEGETGGSRWNNGSGNLCLIMN